MTNALGKNTCNVPINFTLEERAILGRLAFLRDISVGEFIRRNLRRGIALRHPDEAKRLARVRRDRIRSAAMLAILLGALFAGTELQARPVRVVRGGRTASIRRFEEA